MPVGIDGIPASRAATPTRRGVKVSGVRLKFRDAMDPRWAAYPRPNLVNHEADWYTDGHLAEGRPLFGILAMSNYAERLSYLAKRRGRGLEEAAAFFAATRRAMFEVLQKVRAGRRTTRRERAWLRGKVASLVLRARVARAAVSKKKSEKEVDETP